MAVEGSGSEDLDGVISGEGDYQLIAELTEPFEKDLLDSFDQEDRAELRPDSQCESPRVPKPARPLPTCR